jgi:hypothetical protein
MKVQRDLADVRRALDGQGPELRKKPQRRESRLDPYKQQVDAMLRADLDASAKQRHTDRRIFDRLVDEHDTCDISYPMVRVYVEDRRAEVRREAGRRPQAMFVPQPHLPGAEAEVDFGEFHIMLAGKMTRSACSRCGCGTPARPCTDPLTALSACPPCRLGEGEESSFGMCPMRRRCDGSRCSDTRTGSVRPCGDTGRQRGGNHCRHAALGGARWRRPADHTGKRVSSGTTGLRQHHGFLPVLCL